MNRRAALRILAAAAWASTVGRGHAATPPTPTHTQNADANLKEKSNSFTLTGPGIRPNLDKMKPRSVPVAEFAGKLWRLHNVDFPRYFIECD